MIKKVTLVLILTGLFLALLVTVACTGGDKGGVSQQLVKVARGDLTVSVTGSGTIEISREARPTFGSAGKIEKILVKEGDEVREGDVLAELDTSALELALAQAEVALTQAELALTEAKLAQRTAEYNLKNTRDSEDSLDLALLNAQISLDTAEDNLVDTIKVYDWDDYDEVESELNKAQAYYDYALDKLNDSSSTDSQSFLLLLERAKDRLEVAQVEHDNFVAGHKTDKIALKEKQVEAAQLSVAQAQKNIDELVEDIEIQELRVASARQTVAQSEKSVELARQSLDDAQRQLDEATIFAPFDGIVARVLVKEGDNIPSPSMAPQTIIHLIDPGQMELVVEVDEIDIPLLKINQEAVITVDALPDAEFKGVVTAVYPVPKEEGGVVLYDVRLSLDIPESSGIKVGMSASADVLFEERKNVLLVPSRAIKKNDQGETIVKVMADEQIEERRVVIGLDDGLRTEILSGLSDGETVMFEIRAKSSSTSMF